MISFDVRYRWTSALKFSAQIDCDEDAPYSVKLGLAIRWRIATRADLTDADLTRADLTRANLTDADLAHADLTRANLTRANLTDADLAHADLTRANLTRANLTRANLTRANLTDANLTDADLTDADLTDADLTDADLAHADLTRANLRPIRVDFFDVLLRAIPEVPALLAALRAGKIDGSTYEGECACLAGTISKTRGMPVDQLGFADHSRPIERWFLAIREGATPEGNSIAKITEGWILEFMDLVGLKETKAVDDGCPRGDADCLGNNGDCHDACEAP